MRLKLTIALQKIINSFAKTRLSVAKLAKICNNKLCTAVKNCKWGDNLHIGISTACFYPEETSGALLNLCKNSVDTCEIFLNTFSEIEPSYIDSLQNIISDAQNLNIEALHPFTCAMEPFFFATFYDGRLKDGINLYKKYFEICNRLNIPRFIFHGDFLGTPFPFEQHCKNYAILRDVAKDYGVKLCQENVSRCKAGKSENIAIMRDILHDDVYFALDIKQVRRANESQKDILKAMQNRIDYLHLSDASAESISALPGAGTYDFKELFCALLDMNFNGSAVVELYRDDFNDIDELKRSCAYMQHIFDNCTLEKYEK